MYKAQLTDKAKSDLSQKVARATIAFLKRQTGRAPSSVTVVMSEHTLMVTLHETLSPAEKALARSPAGAAQVRDFHRRLFAASSGALKREIAGITGMRLREASADVEVRTGDLVLALTTHRTVDVFLLARRPVEGRMIG